MIYTCVRLVGEKKKRKKTLVREIVAKIDFFSSRTSGRITILQNVFLHSFRSLDR